MLDLEKLKAAAMAATPQDLDTAQSADHYNDGRYIECPNCGGEGSVELEADFLNYDGKALGVQFYGIGAEHGAAEAYFRAASPAIVLELIERLERAESASAPTRIDMLLFCPKCGKQHVDAPDPTPQFAPEDDAWTNPPHRSHLCHACGTIWRPADVPTNGAAKTATRGKADTWDGAASAPTLGDEHSDNIVAPPNDCEVSFDLMPSNAPAVAHPASAERDAFENWWRAKLATGESPIDIAFHMFAELTADRAQSGLTDEQRASLDKLRAEMFDWLAACTKEHIDGKIEFINTVSERFASIYSRALLAKGE